METCSAIDGNSTNSSISYSYSYSFGYSSLNYEDAPSQKAETAVSVIVITLLALVTIVGFIGNSLVILSLAIDTRKLGITSILLGSLAFTDLWITGYVVPMDIRFLIHSEYTFGSFVCVFNAFLQVFAQSSSACMLLVISCERFLVILYPLTSRTMLTRKRTFILVVSCWIVSTGLAALPASYKKVHEFLIRGQCSRVCTNDMTGTTRVIFYFYALLLFYILPLGGMIIANTCVIRALIKSSRYTKKLQSMKSLEKGVKYSTASRNGEATIVDKPIYRNNNANVVTTGEEKSQAADSMVTSASDEDPFPPVSKVKKPKVKSGHSSVAQRKRVVVMLLSVILLYAVCWLPYFIFGMVYILFGVSPTSFGMIIFESFARLMSSCNSAVNPIVYGFMSKNFRQRIIHGLSRLNFWSRRKSRSNSFGSAYTLSTRGSGVSQTNRQTRYSVLPTA